MLSKLVKSAIKKRKLTLFVVMIIFLQGVISYNSIPMNENPQLDLPAVVVTTIYPGANAEEVDRMVTKKIEEAAESIKHFDYSVSTSIPSVSSVIVVSKYGVDYDAVWAELTQALNRVQSELPENCQDIYIDTKLMDTCGAIFALNDSNVNLETLESYTKRLKGELEQISGISRIDLLGENTNQYRVEVDSTKLDPMNIDLRDIEKVIALSAVTFPIGQFDDSNSRVKLISGSALNSERDLSDLMVSMTDQGIVTRLGDIAKISKKPVDNTRVYKHNGESTFMLACYFDNTVNSVAIGKTLDHALSQFKEELPESLTVNKVIFQPKDIELSVNAFVSSLMQGIALVIIVVWLGMGTRNAIIVSFAIPTSLALTFITMKLFGVNIHQISIAALIISLGMLVDNAIVVIDSIQNKLDEGVSKIESCVNGTSEVAIPVLTSTLTTVFAFSPLLLIETITGDYIRSLPLIVITALVASYLTAVLLTPSLSFMLLRPKSEVRTGEDSLVKRYFEKLLSVCLRKSGLVLVALFISIAIAGYLGNLLSPQFFPKEDKNIIYLNLTTEESLDVAHTSEQVKQLTESLLSEAGVDSVTSAIGGVLPKFNDTIPIQVDSVDRAQILLRVNLENAKKTSNAEMVRYLKRKYDNLFPAVNMEFLEIEKGEPVGAPISVRLLASNFDKVVEAKEAIKKIISETEGITDVQDDLLPLEYNMVLDIDNDKANMFGLSRYEIQSELNLALSGKRITSVQTANLSTDVFMLSDVKEKNELERYKIKSSVTNNKQILNQFATIKMEPVRPRILKYNGEYSILITANAMQGYNAIKIQENLTEVFKNKSYKGVSIEMEGEAKRLNNSFGDMGQAALLAIAAVFMVLFIQFYSYSQPLIILVTVPLSIIGSVMGLYFFNQPLSFTAILGIVSLIGIVVNNAIVLVDYINVVFHDQNNLFEACKTASLKRFRPIVLSTLTTAIGLIPLIMTRSELFTPMAVALMSGLLFSMGLTLIVIPVLYFKVHRLLIKLNIGGRNVNV